MELLSSLLSLLTRFSHVLGALIESRTTQFIAFERREVRRAARVFALSIVAALMACGAAGFAAVSVLAALGEEHRAMGSAIIAATLALLALIAVLLARSPR
jgi:protein-S-isoprenylcysteine O-methyltransferase Ste14